MLCKIRKNKREIQTLTFSSFVFQFTKREPEDTKSADSDRDVFNEKPSKEEVMAATQAEGPKRVSDSAIIHTSMGDIHIKLFPVEYVFGSFSVTVFCLPSVFFWWQYPRLNFQAKNGSFPPHFLLFSFPDSFVIPQATTVWLLTNTNQVWQK